jgi:hypothetical protein
MATVMDATGKQRAVKNLGWLVRNWKRVESFEVLHLPGDYEALLQAHLKGGGLYSTHFASTQVLRSWLCRPVFIGVACKWFGKPWVIRKETVQR